MQEINRAACLQPRCLAPSCVTGELAPLEISHVQVTLKHVSTYHFSTIIQAMSNVFLVMANRGIVRDRKWYLAVGVANGSLSEDALNQRLCAWDLYLA